jgi:excisionase family DNA binding protein
VAPAAPGPPRRGFLTTDEVAALLRCSRRVIHELTRTGAIPHRRPSGARRCLFVEAEVLASVDGAELETRELARGGRVVRPAERNGRGGSGAARA